VGTPRRGSRPSPTGYLHGVGISDTLHAGRHHFGTGTYAESLDLRLVGELLGHSDPATTAVYVQYSRVRAVEAVEQLALHFTDAE
jgi:integrase/recombinase XerC